MFAYAEHAGTFQGVCFLLKVLNKTSDIINKILEVLIVILVAAMFIIMNAQVFNRYVLNHSFSWSDAGARYLVVWCTFLGSTIGAKKAMHIKLTFISDKFGKTGQFIIHIITTAFFMLFCLIAAKFGFQILQTIITQKADAFPFSIAYIYSAIPVSMCIILFHLFVDLLNKFVEFFSKQPAVINKED